MKVGDRIISMKHRGENEWAKVVDATVKNIEKGDNVQVRTSYVGEYDDGEQFKFYGWDINKTVFKVWNQSTFQGQITIFDILGGKVNE